MPLGENSTEELHSGHKEMHCLKKVNFSPFLLIIALSFSNGCIYRKSNNLTISFYEDTIIYEIHYTILECLSTMVIWTLAKIIHLKFCVNITSIYWRYFIDYILSPLFDSLRLHSGGANIPRFDYRAHAHLQIDC